MKIQHSSAPAEHACDRMTQIACVGREAVVVAPGRYWIGDPIALFPEVTEWTVPIQIIEGQQVLAFETFDLKTGLFVDENKLIQFNSKSGLLGLVPAALLDCRRMEAMEDSDGGTMICFALPVVCLSSDAGTIRFGPNVTIDTRNPA